MLRAEFRETLDAPFDRMPPVRVGGSGAASVYVIVMRSGVPVARIDVCEVEPAAHPFREVIVWSNHVVVGFGDRLHLVPHEGAPMTFRMQGYFGHLYPLADRLLVADARTLHCLDPSGTKIWESPELGIDGVLVTTVEDGVVAGSGEWDPPGGWEPFRVSLATGARAE